MLVAWNSPTTTYAATFKWIEPSNTQLLILEDPVVDFALRTWAIDRARHSIDSLTYLQSIDDEVGKPLLQAFRGAQNRKGMKGRYLWERLGSYNADFGNVAKRALADANLASPAEVIDFGGLGNLLKGLNVTDMIHEKILIIDAGTPNEMIWIGGRNNSLHATHNLDLGIVLRRIDPSKPWIGEQIQVAFDDTWESVNRVQRPSKRKALEPKVAESFDTKRLDVELRTETQETQYKELVELLGKPVDPSSPLLSCEARPKKMRVLTNEFISYALTGVFGKGFESRKAMPSDILEEAAKYVAEAKRIYISTMSIRMTESFKKSLKTALKNGSEVVLFTNNREAQKTHAPWGITFEFSLPDLAELFAVGGKLTVFALDPNLIKKHVERYPLVTYLHRKLIVADNHVFTGSDNFSESSAKRNSEFVIHVDDEDFASMMKRMVESDSKIFELLSCETVLTELKGYSLFKRGLNRIFMPIY